MGQLTQDNRFLSVTDFSLGKDTFVATAISGSEHISGLFEFEVRMLSENAAISPDDVVGKAATVTLRAKETRYFSGMVSSFEFGEIGPHNHREYRVTLVPWLWFLTRNQNCRIFQYKTTQDIVTSIFTELGFSDFEYQASPGKAREYCVQYNESDFHFVSRLLEEEGISYYFKHTESKHMLMLVDKSNAFEEVVETDLEYSKGNSTQTQIQRWQRAANFRKGKWTLNDYNFKEPTKDLTSSSNSKSAFAGNSKFEHYEYPGLYDFGYGKDLVKIRLEAEESARDTINGSSDCATFYAGGKFAVAKHESATQKDSFVLTCVSHTAQDTSFYAGQDGESAYENEFFAVPSSVPIRPLELHPKPVMKGPQSALVVGPAGEEVYIDEYCRIKAQFYWDREGKENENSSCFIRVVQSWAGNQWGTSFIPRIGQEVIVNFLDGDPDRPLVTGAVYNGKNKPVYSSKTQSGIKTRSTKGGNAQNFNELRFEDKKGSEQIYLHAEKNFDSHVENDQSLTVEKNRKKTVGENETYSVGGDRSKTIGGNQTETIKGDKKTNVTGDHTESISKGMTISIEKDLKESVKGSYTETVTKDSKHSAKTITLNADDEIVLQTGSAKIVMSKSGSISITGSNITVKGSGSVVVKGSTVSVN